MQSDEKIHFAFPAVLTSSACRHTKITDHAKWFLLFEYRFDTNNILRMPKRKLPHSHPSSLFRTSQFSVRFWLDRESQNKYTFTCSISTRAAWRCELKSCDGTGEEEILLHQSLHHEKSSRVILARVTVGTNVPLHSPLRCSGGEEIAIHYSVHRSTRDTL